MCGAAASGNYHWIWNPFDPNDRDVLLGLEDASKGFVAMILAGPFLTGYTQTINDWYDRDIDAINEPNRPIPSGAIKEGEVIAQIWFLLLGGMGLAYGLDVWAGHEGELVTNGSSGDGRRYPINASCQLVASLLITPHLFSASSLHSTATTNTSTNCLSY